MKKLALLNLVLVLSLLLGSVALAQEGDFGVIQRTAEAQLDGWKPVISAEALFENLNDGDTANDPFIVSVRAPDVYELGHIPGAINIPWKAIAKPENLAKLPTDQPIVVYCYTGHTGQVAATVLRLLGYDVQNLKFGMMGWTLNDEVLGTTRFGPDTAARDYPVETEANEATETYAYPEVSTGETDAQEIVRAAADAWLNAEDTKAVVPADAVFDNMNDGDDSNDSLIVSVRAADAYEAGHLAGAINIGWSAIAAAENLAKLPADKHLLVYCYTGHTGQVATTVLGILGYNVSNMKYGMMGWTMDEDVLGTARYDATTAPDYAVEGTAVAAPVELPETGGLALPIAGVLAGMGALTAAAGAFLRRRKAA